MKLLPIKPGNESRFLFLKTMVVLAALILCAITWAWFNYQVLTEKSTVHRPTDHHQERVVSFCTISKVSHQNTHKC